MVKKSISERNKKRLYLVKKYSNIRKLLKVQIKNKKNINDIFFIQKMLQKLPNNSLSIRLKNRCWKTSNGRSYYRDFGLSRHVLREMAHKCLIPGLIKASW